MQSDTKISNQTIQHALTTGDSDTWLIIIDHLLEIGVITSPPIFESPELEKMAQWISFKTSMQKILLRDLKAGDKILIPRSIIFNDDIGSIYGFKMKTIKTFSGYNRFNRILAKSYIELLDQLDIEPLSLVNVDFEINFTDYGWRDYSGRRVDKKETIYANPLF